MFIFHFNLPSKIAYAEGDAHQSLHQAELYIETENGYFPCIGWSDSILSTISMWMGNTIRMLDPRYGEQNVQNYFMNGPYSFTIQKTGKDHIIVLFLRRVGEVEKEELPPLPHIAFTDYCHALLNLVENIISHPNFQWYGKEHERMSFQQSATILKACSPDGRSIASGGSTSSVQIWQPGSLI